MVTQVDIRSPADFLIRVLALGCCMIQPLPWTPNLLERTCASLLSSVTLGLVGVSQARGEEPVVSGLGCSLQSGNPGMEARGGGECAGRHFAQIEISVPSGARAASSTCIQGPSGLTSFLTPTHCSGSYLLPPGHSAFVLDVS